MPRHLLWVLLCVGCASAPPPEPKVVERVVYVEAPCPAPVLVQHEGHRKKPKHKVRRHPLGKHRVEWAKKRAEHCRHKPTEEARERCRRMVSSSKHHRR